MASIQPRAGKWQLRVVHKLLPKPFFHTFDGEAEARAYGAQLEALLASGIVPTELLDGQKRTENPPLSRIITAYLAGSNVAPSDRPTLAQIAKAEGSTKLLSVTASWADLWAGRLKTVDHLAPSTIRKRVESLARVIDWHWRTAGDTRPNPLRVMPRGYASPSSTELATLTRAGLPVRRDVHRDRVLDAAELARVRAALAGHVREYRERPWCKGDAEFTLLFELILATGMRLSEAYRLRVDQIDLVRWVIRVEGSKGHRGAAKPRVVPVVPHLRPLLASWCRDRVGLVFGFWDGTPADRPRCTMRLSARFATLLAYARVPDCTEHDLRHCATCMWFGLRDAAGRWVFSEIEVCRIMGWSDPKMALRYASLRGEDLAARLG